jgi:1,2-diacylglycerol 3-alpha-glucosyltransferase
MMRIGIFSECYHPTLNGVVVSVDTFKKELEKKGHEIFIFTTSTRGFVDKDKSHIFRYPSTTLFGPDDYPVGITLFAPSIAKIAKNLKLDIIHAQHSLGMISGLGLKIAHSEKFPIVHTYHTLLTDYIHWKIGASFGRWYVRTMSTRFCNKCDQIITPSPSMKKIILGYGVRTPITPIPTGIDIPAFQHPFSPEELLKKWGIPKDKKILLYLSRIASEKNIDFLLSAIKKISATRDDFHLIMAGGGKELNSFKKKVEKLGLNYIVTFTDKVAKEDAERCFGAADIFVFPSITETQGIVIIEAMAAGVPAVAIGVMGPSDIISNGEDGFLTELKIEQFNDRIIRLLDDDNLRKQMGAKAKNAAEKYSTESCAQELEKLYEETIDNFHSRSETR